MEYSVVAVTASTVTYEDHTKPKQKRVGGGMEYPRETVFCDNHPERHGSIAPGDHIEIIIRKVHPAP